MSFFFCYLGFLYLACATILPDLLESDVSVVMRLMQVGSFLLGIGFMYFVLILESMMASNTSGVDGMDQPPDAEIIEVGIGSDEL